MGNIVLIKSSDKSAYAIFEGRYGVVVGEFEDSFDTYLQVEISADMGIAKNCVIPVHPDDVMVVGHLDEPETCRKCSRARKVLCADSPGHTVVCGDRNVSAYITDKPADCPLRS